MISKPNTSPTLSRHSTNSTNHTGINTSFDLSATSRVSTNMPVTSCQFTDKGQKYSVPTSELHYSEQRSTACMPDASSITIKLAEEGHSDVPIVTIENEAIHPEITTPSNNACVGDKVASSSSMVVSEASCHASNTGTAAVKNAKFAATDEKLLQLHLKKEKFPYRILRCNVETDLEAGLQTYFELDVLDEDNKFMCDVCTALRIEKQGKVIHIVGIFCPICKPPVVHAIYTYLLGYTSNSAELCEISKQLSIAFLPEILVIHMKRFNFGQQKSSKIISFPLILNMAPYCTNICLEVSKHTIYP